MKGRGLLMKQLTIETIDNVESYNKNYIEKRQKDLPKFLEKFDPIILNQDLIPSDGTIVFAGNHDHVRDQYLVIAAYDKAVHWMAKEEYFDTPSFKKNWQKASEKIKGVKKIRLPFVVLGNVLIHYIFRNQIIKSGAIRIDRFGDSKTGVETAIALAKKGENIGIFPEGTRKTKTDEEAMLLDFKKGAAIIAKEADAYLQPFAKIGLFEDDSIQPVIKFGKPFKIGKRSLEEATKQLQEEVLKLKKELKKEFLGKK